MKIKFLPSAFSRYALLLALILIFLFFGRVLFKNFSGLAIKLFTPLIRLERLVVFRPAPGRSEIEVWRAKVATFEQLAAENKRLKNLLGRKEQGERVGIPAVVLARPPRLPYDTLLIDLGRLNSERPIAPGDLVVLGQVVLGRVTEVADRLSRVELFSAPGQELDVLLGSAGTPKASALASGRGGGEWRLVLPAALAVNPGDQVWSSSFSPYLLGLVEKVASSSEEQNQEIYVRSPVNYFTLTEVEVLK